MKNDMGFRGGVNRGRGSHSRGFGIVGRGRAANASFAAKRTQPEDSIQGSWSESSPSTEGDSHSSVWGSHLTELPTIPPRALRIAGTAKESVKNSLNTGGPPHPVPIPSLMDVDAVPPPPSRQGISIVGTGRKSASTQLTSSDPVHDMGSPTDASFSSSRTPNNLLVDSQGTGSTITTANHSRTLSDVDKASGVVAPSGIADSGADRTTSQDNSTTVDPMNHMHSKPDSITTRDRNKITPGSIETQRPRSQRVVSLRGALKSSGRGRGRGRGSVNSVGEDRLGAVTANQVQQTESSPSPSQEEVVPSRHDFQSDLNRLQDARHPPQSPTAGDGMDLFQDAEGRRSSEVMLRSSAPSRSPRNVENDQRQNPGHTPSSDVTDCQESTMATAGGVSHSAAGFGNDPHRSENVDNTPLVTELVPESYRLENLDVSDQPQNEEPNEEPNTRFSDREPEIDDKSHSRTLPEKLRDSDSHSSHIEVGREPSTSPTRQRQKSEIHQSTDTPKLGRSSRERETSEIRGPLARSVGSHRSGQFFTRHYTAEDRERERREEVLSRSRRDSRDRDMAPFNGTPKNDDNVKDPRIFTSPPKDIVEKFASVRGRNSPTSRPADLDENSKPQIKSWDRNRFRSQHPYTLPTPAAGPNRYGHDSGLGTVHRGSPSDDVEQFGPPPRRWSGTSNKDHDRPGERIRDPVQRIRGNDGRRWHEGDIIASPVGLLLASERYKGKDQMHVTSHLPGYRGRKKWDLDEYSDDPQEDRRPLTSQRSTAAEQWESISPAISPSRGNPNTVSKVTTALPKGAPEKFGQHVRVRGVHCRTRHILWFPLMSHLFLNYRCGRSFTPPSSRIESGSETRSCR
ncbi:hypothetical protein M427DRAFT_448843 [Gonapodya prolifera JEL478]|uniref:Uncharacterized protein n=1 Tax=Gonapodya prolifera (strain JEL478) TaxID=1344416 RepID=A0A139ART8_GONPJ|nr:hypothetical protein M427DRAFT_448843 [Gonapodya prolifera JEL478]|eukprot:KXS19374.1 hypothetical protein M427DRAFT_448843 [Gonapodya prolifera JEL478]